MAEPEDDFEREERRERLRQRATQGGLGVLVVVLAVGGWIVLNPERDPTKRAVPPSTIIPVEEPPPPPPPPPEEPEPEEPEPEEEPITEPDEPAPPEPQPQPAEAAPQGAAIDGPAQAGADAFGVRAGEGGRGPVIGGPGGAGGTGRPGGGGFAESGYSRYLSAMLQQAIQADERINRQIFTAEVAVWIDARGRITRVNLLQTSGNSQTDKSLVARLQSLPELDEPPPASLRFPQRVRVRGRRA